MTFKGKRYETIIDIERLIMVEKARRKAYDSQLKYAQLKRNMKQVQELEIEINLQDKFIEELEGISEELLEDLRKISLQLGDREALIFLERFILGTRRKDLLEKYHLTLDKYRYAIIKITEELKDSHYAKDVIEFLRKEGNH